MSEIKKYQVVKWTTEETTISTMETPQASRIIARCSKTEDAEQIIEALTALAEKDRQIAALQADRDQWKAEAIMYRQKSPESPVKKDDIVLVTDKEWGSIFYGVVAEVYEGWFWLATKTSLAGTMEESQKCNFASVTITHLAPVKSP